jgi:hypothetical protein
MDVEVAPGVDCSFRYADPDRSGKAGKSISVVELRRLYDRLEDISPRVDDAHRELYRISASQIPNRETKSRGRRP